MGKQIAKVRSARKSRTTTRKTAKRNNSRSILARRLKLFSPKLALSMVAAVFAAGITGLFIFSDAATPPYRAFTNDSYWNTPFPANAPIDANSAKYIADSQANSQNYLNLVMTSSYGQPIYFSSASDPLYTVSGAGYTTQVRIPANAQQASGSDGQFVVFDRTPGYNRVVGLYQANFANGKWTADGIDTYQLDGNGLDKKVGGDSLSGGHRGINAAVRAVRYDEVVGGVIDHRLECFWHATAEKVYWPMTGYESGKGGIVPEGIAIRIKPSVNLDAKGLTPAAKVIATALQKYGCVIGDNSGSGNNLKVQNNVNWGTMLTKDALKNIPWSDWEFVQGGYKPSGTNTSPTPTPTPPPSPTPDTSAPTVTISSPSANATVSGQVPYSVVANDNVGVTKLEFMVDNNMVYSGSSKTYNWNTASVSNGTHALKVKAYDAAGNNTLSGTVTVNVQNSTPTNPTDPTPPPDVTGTVIKEDFSSSAANFTVEGGTWKVVNGKYELTSAASGKDGVNANRSLNKQVVNGSFTLTAKASAKATSTAYNDFSVLFGYVNAKNYLYASFNETNSGQSHGIFKMVNGTKSQLVDFKQLIKGGTTYTVKITRAGNTVKVWLNDTLYGTVTTELFPEGKVGFATINNPAMFDDLNVTGTTSGGGSGGGTGGAADTTAPSAPTNLVAKADSASTISLTWRASTDNIAVTRYSILRNGFVVGTTPGNITTYTDTGLQPSTSYNYVVVASDAANNTSVKSNTVSATTQNGTPVSDTAAPTAPANLKAAPVAANQINLTWSASTDNVAVRGYDVYRNGSKIATVNALAATSYGDATLQAGTTYTYTVRAFDAAGNVSPASNQASATTLSPTTPPPTGGGNGAGICGITSTPPAQYENVIWIIYENHRVRDLVGSASAPYFNSLYRACGTANNYAQAGSPSLPNYIAATTGSTQGITSNASPSLTNVTADNIFRQVRAKGKVAKTYSEGMPSNCAQSGSGEYVPKHNPEAHFKGADDRANCLVYNVPMGTPEAGNFINDLNGNLPAFSVIVPDMCNGTHDCSVATGDKWLNRLVPKILSSNYYKSGKLAVIILYDEYTPLPNIFISPSVRPGASVASSSHYSLLRTTEEMLGITNYLAGAGSAPSMRNPLNL